MAFEAWETWETPEEGGFDAGKLSLVEELFERRIREKKLAGASFFVSRGGKIALCSALGDADKEEGRKLRKDAVFRLASMTKPIVAVAVMTLVEQGKIGLTDSIGTFIPEFGGEGYVAVPDVQTSVAAYEPDPEAPAGAMPTIGLSYALEPAIRPIKVRDLLTHSCGLGQGPVGFSELRMPGEGATLAGHIPSWASVPLDFQPGALTGYSPIAAFDLLGRIVEVASGQPLDLYLRRAIFEPLGMRDTTFVLSAEQRRRIVAMYESVDQELRRTEQQYPFFHPTYYSGAGGLFGTLEDYCRFAGMLAGGGAFAGTRILGADTVREMASPQLPDAMEGFPKWQTWGLGIRVITDGESAGTPLTTGSYGWSGAWGTHFWIDPGKDLFAVLMTNLANAGGSEAEASREFEIAVTGAML
ncbi:serine hydrolase [Cohnella sp. GbtcB17]|uniref:serine hydrolase domain-containing protein n=1 Tax=Cohnella sp. GbtcB17 TaxID=2824762 RepID=UPI0020C656A4|nr:serine hydrolase domain-containing protein [Cohnella sp. GbtcB17]